MYSAQYLSCRGKRIWEDTEESRHIVPLAEILKDMAEFLYKEPKFTG